MQRLALVLVAVASCQAFSPSIPTGGLRRLLPNVARHAGRPLTSRVSMVANPPVTGAVDGSKVFDSNGKEVNLPGMCDVTDLEMVQYLEMILKAKVYDICVETPLTRMGKLSDRVENSINLKREDMQPVFSFKLRGAYNMIANLPQSERDKGIITASAGNHAQGCAMSAKHLGCKAIIAMPTVTPDIKVSSVRRLGAEVVLVGDTFDETSKWAKEQSAERGMPYIPPFDHPLVIAGQGTIGMELLRQSSTIDAVFIPVGGGGLIAGIGTYLKRLRPDIKIIGVEPYGANALYQSLKAGERVTLDKVDTFADGVAVKVVGEKTFELCKSVVDDVVLVDTDEICSAIKDIFEDTRSITEPSGALGVAGAKKYAAENGLNGKNLVAIASGANMNFDRLRFVAERSGTGQKEEAMLATFILEEKGSFRRFIHQLSASGIARGVSKRSITEFKYRYNPSGLVSNGNKATVFYSVDTESREDAENLVEQLKEGGLETYDLSKNDLSKDHVRFLAGGHAEVENEEIYKIEFPEKAGSLRMFLDAMNDEYDISLFHYRTTGTFTGQVLVGLALPSDRKRDFEKVVDGLGWSFSCETNNIAATLFL